MEHRVWLEPTLVANELKGMPVKSSPADGHSLPCASVARRKAQGGPRRSGRWTHRNLRAVVGRSAIGALSSAATGYFPSLENGILSSKSSATLSDEGETVSPVKCCTHISSTLGLRRLQMSSYTLMQGRRWFVCNR